MKTTRLRDVRALLDEHGIHPSKALGQNFLVDANVLERIVDEAEIGPEDETLEIGPGLGGLTEALARRARRVVAVETDFRLCALLRERMAGAANVELIHGDALETDFAALFAGRPWKVVSNLPYSVGTRILVRLFETPFPPARIVVTLQKDVAERLVAPPGTRVYGLLAIWAQRLYEVRIARTIPASCFYPTPSIVSAVADLRLRPTPRWTPRDPVHFKELTRRAFMRRRKQIRRILLDLPASLRAGGAPEAVLAALDVAPEARPETLPVEIWGALSDALAPPAEKGGGAPCG